MGIRLLVMVAVDAAADQAKLAFDERILVVGIGGTTRLNTSTERALAVTLAAVEQLGGEVRIFAGAQLAALPPFAPDRAECPPEAVELVETVRVANGIVIASPGYHGSVSGLVKNALDYLEYLRHDSRPYLSDRAVGCIATGAGWQGAVTTLVALRSVVHALRGWPTPLGAAINSAGPVFDDESGECIDDPARLQLEIIGREVVEFARMKALRLGAAGTT